MARPPTMLQRVWCAVVPLLALAWAVPAAATIDLNGKWRVEYGNHAVEFVDVAQTGTAVSTTLHQPDGYPIDVPLEGTFPDGTLYLTLVPPSCPSPCVDGMSVRLVPTGNDGNGRLVLGGPPAPGVDTVLIGRCECFDGNATNGDGCDASCRVEPCFACAGMPSLCTPEPDGAACEDGSPCTTGRQCSGGVCGGGGPVAPCVDLTGDWNEHAVDSFVGIAQDFVVAIRQRDTTVLFRNPDTGSAGFLGTIDPGTGAFDLWSPNTSLLCSPTWDTLSGSAALDGASFSGTGTSTLTTPHACLGDTFFVTAVRGVCGNGVIEPGEGCDDGNLTDGDGCDASCRVELCNACTGGAPSICVPAVPAGCSVPTDPHRAKLRLTNVADPGRDLLDFRTSGGTALAPAALGDPRATTAYRVCLLDRSAPAPGLLFAADVPAGGMCNGVPCWKATRTGFAFTNRASGPQGVRTLTLAAGADGTVRAKVQAKGPFLSGRAHALPSPPLPVPLTLVVQSRVGCVAADFPASGVTRNDPASGRFVATGGP